LKKETRGLLLKLLRSAGVFAAWRRLHRDDIVILMLHGTADPKRPSLWTPLRPQFSPERIDWCLEAIGRHYRFVSLDMAVDILKGEIPPVEHGIAVTLDDGYRSNIADALPVFRKHGVPVTIFLTVANVENRTPFWFDRLDYALQASGPGGASFDVGGVDSVSPATGGTVSPLLWRLPPADQARVRPQREYHRKMEDVIAHFEGRGGRSLADIFEDDPWAALLDWGEMSATGRGRPFRKPHAGPLPRRPPEAGRLRAPADRVEGSERGQDGVPCRFIAYSERRLVRTAGRAREGSRVRGGRDDGGRDQPGRVRPHGAAPGRPPVDDGRGGAARPRQRAVGRIVASSPAEHRERSGRLKIAVATSFPADSESPAGGVEAVSVVLCRALFGARSL
jgi:hypothetical protein